MSIIKPYSKKVRKTFKTTGPTMTKQQFKDECDINTLLRRYQKNGILEHVNRFQGNYADITDLPDYHDAMQKIVLAQEAFDSLPSEIRKDFRNDPAAFVEFVSDPANQEAIYDYGLAERPTEIPPEPAPAEPVPGDGGTPPAA